MHSAGMSRRSSSAQHANVGIGTDFKAPVLEAADTRRKADDWLEKHGDVHISNRKNKTLRLYQKWKAGELKPDCADAVYRNNKAEFDKFKKQGL